MSKRKIVEAMVMAFVRGLNEVLAGSHVRVTFTQDKKTGRRLATIEEKI